MVPTVCAPFTIVTFVQSNIHGMPKEKADAERAAKKAAKKAGLLNEDEEEEE